MQTDLDQATYLCLPYAKKNKEERGKGEDEQVGEEDAEEKKRRRRREQILFPIIS